MSDTRPQRSGPVPEEGGGATAKATSAEIGRPPAWLAVDWGTTRLRVLALDETDEVIAHRESERGMDTLSPEAFEEALLELVAPLLAPDRATLALCCGMVGARQGWIEAPYRETPCVPLDAATLVTAPTRERRLHALVVPGLAQRSPPDVMRGEETQIAGLLAERPGFEGTVCLPGTHGKWARVAHGRIERFATVPSGELFALLAERSVLRHSVAAAGWDTAAFAAAVDEALAEPATLTRRLFGLRAADLLEGLAPAAARARLSGYLIGAEIAAVETELDADGEIVLVGEPALAARYAEALARCGRRTERVAAERLTLAALAAVRAATPALAATGAPR